MTAIDQHDLNRRISGPRVSWESVGAHAPCDSPARLYLLDRLCEAVGSLEFSFECRRESAGWPTDADNIARSDEMIASLSARIARLRDAYENGPRMEDILWTDRAQALAAWGEIPEDMTGVIIRNVTLHSTGAVATFRFSSGIARSTVEEAVADANRYARSQALRPYIGANGWYMTVDGWRTEEAARQSWQYRESESSGSDVEIAEYAADEILVGGWYIAASGQIEGINRATQWSGGIRIVDSDRAS